MGTRHRGFEPDYALPPGATLRDAIEEREMSQADLARRLGMAEKTVSQIMNGVAPLTHETAEKLELVLGIPAHFWNSRELLYRERLTKIEAFKSLEKESEWLKQIPWKELVARNWVEESDAPSVRVHNALSFFGVSSVDTWQTTWNDPSYKFRGKDVHSRKPGHVAAWLRMGEIKAQKLRCREYSESEFICSLRFIREKLLVLPTNWQQDLIACCANAGVALIFEKEITGAAVSGVAKWLSPSKALIQLSLKYKKDDQFWFTFFHEACHILKHGKRSIFLEDGRTKDSQEEIEADEFARDTLIPKLYDPRLPGMRTRSAIVAFAESIAVTPGIVVGRLQHDKLIPNNHHNDIKTTFTWGQQ